MKRDEIVVIMILIAGALFVYFFGYNFGYSRATIWTNGEGEFSEPIDIVWHGEIISTMVSGLCVGLKGDFDGHTFFMACLDDDRGELWDLQGQVTIKGKWVGNTCAYKNTVFGGCVPDVLIEKIEK